MFCGNGFYNSTEKRSTSTLNFHVLLSGAPKTSNQQNYWIFSEKCKVNLSFNRLSNEIRINGWSNDSSWNLLAQKVDLVLSYSSNNIRNIIYPVVCISENNQRLTEYKHCISGNKEQQNGFAFHENYQRQAIRSISSGAISSLWF